MSGAGVRARIHVLDPRAGVLATAGRSDGVTCASEYAPPLSGLSAVGQWHAMCRGPPEVVTTSLTGAERSAMPLRRRSARYRVALRCPSSSCQAGSVIVTSGATAELRGRRRELRTLRALGWARSEISRRLLREFALLALVMSLAALLVACMCEAVVVHTSLSAWDVLAIPAGVVMTIAAAWWPVRQATAASDPMATARVHRPSRLDPWAAVDARPGNPQPAACAEAHRAQGARHRSVMWGTGRGTRIAVGVRWRASSPPGLATRCGCRRTRSTLRS